jgi:hypothetical protein
MRKEWDERLYAALKPAVGYGGEWVSFRRKGDNPNLYTGVFGEYRVYRNKTLVATPYAGQKRDWFVTRWNGRRWFNVSKRFGKVIRMKAWPEFEPDE